mgnify:CR=1 FL=1
MKLLILIMFILCPKVLATVDDVSTPEVFQREYIYTSFQEHKNIQTVGVFTCVAMVILDKNGYGALAHFDASTDLERGVDEVLSAFNGAREVSVSLYGGQSPYRLEKRIVEKLEGHGVVPDLIERNSDPEGAMNINVNLRSGVISKYVESISNMGYRERAFKADRMKFSKRLYRHQGSIGGGDFLPDFSEEEENLFNFSF